MEEEEMKQFVLNWKAIVAQEAVGFIQNEDSLNSTVESFLHLFDHYFGNRIREMISSNDEAQAQIPSVWPASASDTPTESNSAGQAGSDRGQKRKSESDTTNSNKKKGKED